MKRQPSNSQINRHLRSIAARANDRNANGKAAARRRKQMLAGQLKAENGVVMRFDDGDSDASGT